MFVFCFVATNLCGVCLVVSVSRILINFAYPTKCYSEDGCHFLKQIFWLFWMSHSVCLRAWMYVCVHAHVCALLRSIAGMYTWLIHICFKLEISWFIMCCCFAVVLAWS